MVRIFTTIVSSIKMIVILYGQLNSNITHMHTYYLHTLKQLLLRYRQHISAV